MSFGVFEVTCAQQKCSWIWKGRSILAPVSCHPHTITLCLSSTVRNDSVNPSVILKKKASFFCGLWQNRFTHRQLFFPFFVTFFPLISPPTPDKLGWICPCSQLVLQLNSLPLILSSMNYATVMKSLQTALNPGQVPPVPPVLFPRDRDRMYIIFQDGDAAEGEGGGSWFGEPTGRESFPALQPVGFAMPPAPLPSCT